MKDEGSRVVEDNFGESDAVKEGEVSFYRSTMEQLTYRRKSPPPEGAKASPEPPPITMGTGSSKARSASVLKAEETEMSYYWESLPFHQDR